MGITTKAKARKVRAALHKASSEDYRAMVVGLIMYEKDFAFEEAQDLYDRFMDSDHISSLFDLNQLLDE